MAKNSGVPIVSDIFDTYWKFAAERQEIFFNKMDNPQGPWSKDPILNAHKFTNAYRASDRVSQYLIRNVIYNGDWSAEDLFLRVMLFKVFNKIDTWKRLKKIFGEPTAAEFNAKAYTKAMQQMMDDGIQIYAAAYISPPSVMLIYPHARKHGAHLLMIEDMLKKEYPARMAAADSLEGVFNTLKESGSLGNFLAYQYTIDLNYSPLLKFKERDFVIPGPGARSGIRKAFKTLGEYSETEIIHYMAENQNEEFDRLGINFRNLWGRPLQLIDCQNLFCEFDKFSRVAHPDAKGVKIRTRIKQVYDTSALAKPINYMYPVRWGINKNIGKAPWNNV